LREKYKSGGCAGFLDYELLELLLTYCIERRDVRPLARELLDKFGGIEDVLKADTEELTKVSGAGVQTAVFFHLIADIATKIYRERLKDRDLSTLTSKNDLLHWLRGNLAFLSAENFMVLFLDVKNTIIATKVLSVGTIDKSAVYPREIIKEVLRCDAKSVIFAHNHPSGSTDPSARDKEFTDHMRDCLKEFDIHLIDHIIISKESYFSFLEYGILK